jgi:hypothetical protein
MAPQIKDIAWTHVDVLDNEMYCKYCKKHIKGCGGIHRLKQHLASIRSQVAPCGAKHIGHIRLKMQKLFEKFKENKARQKEIDAQIG